MIRYVQYFVFKTPKNGLFSGLFSY